MHRTIESTHCRRRRNNSGIKREQTFSTASVWEGCRPSSASLRISDAAPRLYIHIYFACGGNAEASPDHVTRVSRRVYISALFHKDFRRVFFFFFSSSFFSFIQLWRIARKHEKAAWRSDIARDNAFIGTRW